MDTTASQQHLRTLVDAIVAGDHPLFSKILATSPTLASASFTLGATRAQPDYFIEEIGYCIYFGDTALHLAAAAYRHHMAELLISAGAGVRAKNRRGTEPLHAAASGSPGSPRWDPVGQAATIATLIEGGADPNAQNKDGATPLHRAVRTRCAAAVRVLLHYGANPAIGNKSGSTPIQLASWTTGRGGSGSHQAKAQQQEILQLLQGRIPTKDE